MELIMILLIILFIVVILGLGSIDHRLKKKLANDERIIERIIERLDLLINDKRKSTKD
ncbi:hypothetical protein [Paenibacillus foliorum]|uniref:hypothetical protein n=1 Tax=Paenibacillus foliorum TaxID=2654974 RepID=UPI001491C691|nr:hypothetical protein [Paenibacillus foliorum]